MADIKSTVMKSTPVTRYYKYTEPAEPFPPSNSELFAYEYRGFLVLRENSEFVLWEIKTLENGIPPVPLRGSFTVKTMCEKAVDSFLKSEAIKQAASEKQ